MNELQSLHLVEGIDKEAVSVDSRPVCITRDNINASIECILINYQEYFTSVQSAKGVYSLLSGATYISTSTNTLTQDQSLRHVYDSWTFLYNIASNSTSKNSIDSTVDIQYSYTYYLEDLLKYQALQVKLRIYSELREAIFKHEKLLTSIFSFYLPAFKSITFMNINARNVMFNDIFDTSRKPLVHRTGTSIASIMNSNCNVMPTNINAPYYIFQNRKSNTTKADNIIITPNLLSAENILTLLFDAQILNTVSYYRLNCEVTHSVTPSSLNVHLLQYLFKQQISVTTVFDIISIIRTHHMSFNSIDESLANANDSVSGHSIQSRDRVLKPNIIKKKVMDLLKIISIKQSVCPRIESRNLTKGSRGISCNPYSLNTYRITYTEFIEVLIRLSALSYPLYIGIPPASLSDKFLYFIELFMIPLGQQLENQQPFYKDVAIPDYIASYIAEYQRYNQLKSSVRKSSDVNSPTLSQPSKCNSLHSVSSLNAFECFIAYCIQIIDKKTNDLVMDIPKQKLSITSNRFMCMFLNPPIKCIQNTYQNQHNILSKMLIFPLQFIYRNELAVHSVTLLKFYVFFSSGSALLPALSDSSISVELLKLLSTKYVTHITIGDFLQMLKQIKLLDHIVSIEEVLSLFNSYNSTAALVSAINSDEATSVFTSMHTTSLSVFSPIDPSSLSKIDAVPPNFSTSCRFNMSTKEAEHPDSTLKLYLSYRNIFNFNSKESCLSEAHQLVIGQGEILITMLNSMNNRLTSYLKDTSAETVSPCLDIYLTRIHQFFSLTNPMFLSSFLSTKLHLLEFLEYILILFEYVHTKKRYSEESSTISSLNQFIHTYFIAYLSEINSLF